MTRSASSLPETLPADLRAGLVTFLVALPLCLGIALASGAPPLAGIIGGVVGGLIVGLLSGSSLSVSGPAAGLTTIVAANILKLGTFETFLVAVMLAGALQVAFGFARAGAIANYFPSAVIKGMLAAIGLTLILKQIPHAVGYDADAEGDFAFFQPDGATTFSEIGRAFHAFTLGASLITLASLIILLLWARPAVARTWVGRNVPGALVAVLVGVGLNAVFSGQFPDLALNTRQLVQLPVLLGGPATGGAGALLRLPAFGTGLGQPQVWLAALTIAIVASLETLLNVEATDKLDPLHRRTPANRELKAQGVGNLISGLLGGIPVTSVIVRSSVNLTAGARTKHAAIVHGILLLGCVVLIPGLLNRIPLAALAGILLFTGYKLTKPALYGELWRLGLNQFLPFITTIVAVLLTDLLIGIGIGVVVGLFFILRANFRTTFFFRRDPTPGITDAITINLADHVSFLNKASIITILDQLPDDSVVQIDGRQSSYIDYDVVETIENFRETARLRNIHLTFLPGPGASATGRYAAAPALDVARSLASNPVTELLDAPTPPPVPADADLTRYHELFANNRHWVAEKLRLSPTYFTDMARGQSPQFLFIGCSDSRVTLDTMTGTNPGEIFVHRNIANLVIPTDLNALSVIQYAITALKVQHVVVVGHYGCGGIRAAMARQDLGLINKWLIPIRDVMRLHREELQRLPNESDRFRRLVELNIQEQVYNLCKTSFVQQAWAGKEHQHVHGWVYDIREGLLRDLEIDVRDLLHRDDDLFRLTAGIAGDGH